MMNHDEFVGLYQDSLIRRLEPMQQSERIAFLSDVFGKRWHDVYRTLDIINASLVSDAIPPVDDKHLDWPGKDQGKPKPQIIWLDD